MGALGSLYLNFRRVQFRVFPPFMLPLSRETRFPQHFENEERKLVIDKFLSVGRFLYAVTTYKFC